MVSSFAVKNNSAGFQDTAVTGNLTQTLTYKSPFSKICKNLFMGVFCKGVFAGFESLGKYHPPFLPSNLCFK